MLGKLWEGHMDGVTKIVGSGIRFASELGPPTQLHDLVFLSGDGNRIYFTCDWGSN